MTYPHHDPHTHQPPPPLPPPPTGFIATPAPPKRRKAWPWLVGALAAVVLLCCGIGVAANLGDPDIEPAAATNPTTPPPATTAAAPTQTAATPTTPPPTTPTTTKPAPKPTKKTYKALTERQWKLIAKNPDAYLGKTYVVYGTVTQFDSATGDDTFRANVGHRNEGYSFEYDTNTLLRGTASRLGNLVEDDEFRANVTVLGSYSYETQIGGETTVPLLMVDSFKVL